MLIREVMSSPAFTLRAGAGVGAAAQFLVQHGFTAAPVVDEDGLLVGIVTELDLIRGRIAPDPRRRSSFARHAHRNDETEVVAVMTTPVESLTPGADIADAAQMMVDERIRAIPIVDGLTIVGILTRRDLLRTNYGIVGPKVPSK